jgi:hypothetical protein
VRLTLGTQLGPYEVVSFLGAGGMAEVYRARDTRLGRDIALKVVKESRAASPELVRRFEQEARIAGSLNHPNLVAVYDFGLHDGTPYFVTELLQGESLRHRLSRGRIPLLTALDWAAQMARGLAAAHGRGVIHRDVKPDNVFIGADGQVKLLDFGIAKLAEVAHNDGPHGLMDTTVTRTGRATQTGSVLGTPGYMSPEQVRGEPLDPRTDIFSLGAVLYEMLSGQRAFPGASVVESGYPILHNDPAPLPSEAPPSIAQVVRRCLEKEPARRFQSASDLAFALEVLRIPPTGSAGHVPAVSRGLGPRGRTLIGVTTAVLVALALGLVRGQRRPSTVSAMPDVEPVTFRWGTIGAARFLPDGRVVFSAAFEGRPEEIFVRPSGSPTAQALGLQDVRLLAASAMGELAVVLHPKYSYLSTRQGTLARIPSVGGTPRELAENAEFADWSPGGDLAVVRQSGADCILESPPGHPLFRTNGYISDPRFSSRGDRIAFIHHPVAGDDMGEVVVTDMEGRTRTLSPRWPTTSGLAWSPGDSEIWFTGGTIRKNRLVAVSLGGKTRAIYQSLSEIRLDDVGKDGQVLISNQLDRSELVYAGDGGGRQTLLSWTDWTYPLAALSADGKVLFSTLETVPAYEDLQSTSVMLRNTDGAPAQVLGEGLALDLSPDGRWALVVSSDRTKLTALPTGAGQPRSITTDGLVVRTARWMSGGKEAVVTGRAPGDSHVRLYRLGRDASSPVPVSDTALSYRGRLEISRDGRWAAAMDEDLRLVIISMEDGTALPVPRTGTDAVVPRSWSPEGNLWVTETGRELGARARLILLEPRTGKVLEERSIGPSDSGGAGTLVDLVLSPDGRKVAFTYGRKVGSLYIARGLGR